MKDKYDEVIRCSRCRHEIEDKDDLHINYYGMVYCTKCHKVQEFKEYSTIESMILGQRKKFNIPDDNSNGEY